MVEPAERTRRTAQKLLLTGALRTLARLIVHMQQERSGIQDELERLDQESKKIGPGRVDAYVWV